MLSLSMTLKGLSIRHFPLEVYACSPGHGEVAHNLVLLFIVNSSCVHIRAA